MRDRRLRAGMACALMLAGGSLSAQTPGGGDFQATVWASSCMACHGTDGRAQGTGLTLVGRPADELYALLLAYKQGSRQGTVMNHHARGYQDEELRRIARHFSQIK